MTESPALPGAPTRCVFCSRPVAAAERCPLLPSSHWTCCCCEVPEAGRERTRVETGAAAVPTPTSPRNDAA
jgi:hypothetical protein